MNKNQLKNLFNSIKKDLNITDNIRLELRPMKIKAASISIHKRVIRLNKNILSYLDEKTIKYLMIHELIHYKLKSIYHTEKFYRQLEQNIKNDDLKNLEENIIKALLQINHVSTRKFQW